MNLYWSVERYGDDVRYMFWHQKWADFKIFDSVGFAPPISTTCHSRTFDKCVVRLVVGG
jgi:hypothetical protein